MAVDTVQLVQIRATLAKKIHTEHVSWEMRETGMSEKEREVSVENDAALSRLRGQTFVKCRGEFTATRSLGDRRAAE